MSASGSSAANAASIRLRSSSFACTSPAAATRIPPSTGASCPSGGPVKRLIARGNELEVQAQLMRVMRPDDVLVTKLMAMTEHALSYESCLEIARSLREQIDWDYVRRRTAGSPFARAFFELVDGLEIVSTA